MSNRKNIVYGRLLKVKEENGRVVKVETVDSAPKDNNQTLKGEWKSAINGMVDIDEPKNAFRELFDLTPVYSDIKD